MRQFLSGTESRRRMAMRVSCPHCGALINHPCVGARSNVRRALHQDRYAKALGQVPA